MDKRKLIFRLVWCKLLLQLERWKWMDSAGLKACPESGRQDSGIIKVNLQSRIRIKMVRELWRTKTVVLLFVLSCFFLTCSDDGDDEQLFVPSAAVTEDVFFQAYTLGGLMDGEYDGEMTYSQLAGYGDFGIGTFNGLDGEMVMLDGVFYQIQYDGEAYSVAGTTKCPFAMLTYFEADTVFELQETLSYQQLQDRLDEIVAANNTCQAIR